MSGVPDLRPIAYEIPAAARDFAWIGLTAVHHGPSGGAGTHHASQSATVR